MNKEILVKYLQTSWTWFKTHKKKWLVFLALSLLFFIIRFPYKPALRYAVNTLKAQTRSQFQLNWDSFYIHPLGPAVVLKNPKFKLRPEQNELQLSELKIYPLYKALFTLKPGMRIVLKHSSSEVELQMQKTNLEKNIKGFGLTINTRRLDPSLFSDLFPLLSKVQSRIDFYLKIKWDPQFKQSPKGEWRFRAENTKSQALSYTLPGTIGTISLPAFQWKNADSSGEIKKEEILISDINFGEEKEPFQWKMRGVFSINFNKNRFSAFPRMSIKNYNTALDIIVNPELKKKLYFLDLFFEPAARKISTGWRYLAQIKGNRVNFFDLSPVESLPSLAELQGPKNPNILDSLN